ncbi:hypothetical protein VNO77_46287 [Canavalia gladiata]|uniref:Uncharacterized protein n=1 Tax=Canavalia gladiata TaxID=3824 RepID=A0AAN9JEH9_CANGL
MNSVVPHSTNLTKSTLPSFITGDKKFTAQPRKASTMIRLRPSPPPIHFFGRRVGQSPLSKKELLTPSAFLPDPSPGIVLALHPTHMIDKKNGWGTYALLNDAFLLEGAILRKEESEYSYSITRVEMDILQPL